LPINNCRIAAASPDTYPAVGERGLPIFINARYGSFAEFAPEIRAYREAYRAAGHEGRGQVYLRVPTYLAATEEQRQILRMHLAGQSFGRPFFSSPGLPEDRKAALRAAFDATMRDADFIGETNKVKLEVSPTSGADIDRLLAEVYATPKDVIEKAKQAIRN